MGTFLDRSDPVPRGKSDIQMVVNAYSTCVFVAQVYEKSYLRHQRAEYLQQQLALEKMASEIVFHTISITNALSPDEYFEQVSLPTIRNIFIQDPFGKICLHFYQSHYCI